MTDYLAVTRPGWLIHIRRPPDSLLALGTDGQPSLCGQIPDEGWKVPEADEARDRIRRGDLCERCRQLLPTDSHGRSAGIGIGSGGGAEA